MDHGSSSTIKICVNKGMKLEKSNQGRGRGRGVRHSQYVTFEDGASKRRVLKDGPRNSQWKDSDILKRGLLLTTGPENLNITC